MFTQTLLPLLPLLPLLTLTTAHFDLLYPPSRGGESGTSYPCGDKPNVGDRTSFPLSNAPVQIYDEHTEAMVSVVLALGSDPSAADFTTQLYPTVVTRGPQNFCFGDVDVLAVLMAGNSSLTESVLEGMNATLMVSTGSAAEGGEGLYNCADITLTSTTLSTSDYDSNCKNSTGVTVTMLDNGSRINANGTAVGGESSTTSSSSSSATTTSSSSGFSSSDTGNAGIAFDAYVPALTGLLATVGAVAFFGIGGL